jgi:carboxypeptidase D
VEYSTVQIMQTYPQLFGFQSNVYEYFVEQYNLCGYNLTLSYPSSSPYPTLRATGHLSKDSGDDTSDDDDDDDSDDIETNDTAKRVRRLLELYDIQSRNAIEVRGRGYVKRATNATVAPPPLSPTGVIDPDYQCHVLEHLEHYAQNFTVPWSKPYRHPLISQTDSHFQPSRCRI